MIVFKYPLNVSMSFMIYLEMERISIFKFKFQFKGKKDDSIERLHSLTAPLRCSYAMQKLKIKKKLGHFNKFDNKTI